MDEATKLIVREAATQAAEEAVRSSLIALGIDVDDPIEAQKDMAALRTLRELATDPEFQADMMHVREWRRAMDGVKKKSVAMACLLMAVGGAVFVVLALKGKLTDLLP